MEQALFPDRRKRAAAAMASLASLAALTFYVAGPVQAEPSFSATVVESTAAGTTISGVVRTPGGRPLRNARVRIVFRDEDGNLIRKFTVRVGRDGRFRVRVPAGVEAVRVKVFEGTGDDPRVVTRAFQVEPGERIDVTATFPTRGGGLLPGLFPY